MHICNTDSMDILVIMHIHVHPRLCNLVLPPSLSISYSFLVEMSNFRYLVKNL